MATIFLVSRILHYQIRITNRQEDTSMSTRVDGVRAFNRFYTKQIGLITDHLLDTPHTLPQARVLYELATAGRDLTASHLAGLLNLDPGYMSKLVTSLERKGLLRRIRPESGWTATTSGNVYSNGSIRSPEPGDLRKQQRITPAPASSAPGEAAAARSPPTGSRREDAPRACRSCRTPVW